MFTFHAKVNGITTKFEGGCHERYNSSGAQEAVRFINQFVPLEAGVASEGDPQVEIE